MDTKPPRNKPLGFVVVLALVVLVLVIDMRRRAAEDQLAQLSVRLNQVNGEDTQQQEQDKKQAEEIVAKVRRLIEIPTDIEPTVATIVDAEKLREKNAFYANAKNGDILIVTSTRAILYRPSENKIIDVVPVQIQAPAAKPAATTPPAAAPVTTPPAAPVTPPPAAAPVTTPPAAPVTE